MSPGCLRSMCLCTDCTYQRAKQAQILFHHVSSWDCEYTLLLCTVRSEKQQIQSSNGIFSFSLYRLCDCHKWECCAKPRFRHSQYLRHWLIELKEEVWPWTSSWVKLCAVVQKRHIAVLQLGSTTYQNTDKINNSFDPLKKRHYRKVKILTKKNKEDSSYEKKATPGGVGAT